MLHEIHGVRDFGRDPLVGRIQRAQAVLDQQGQGAAVLPGPEKDLGTVVSRVREGVLVDADQGGVLRGLNGRYPVVEVGNLLFPQCGRRGVVQRDIAVPQEHRDHAVKAQKLIQLLDHGQIDDALGHARPGHCAAVFPAVSGVQNQPPFRQAHRGQDLFRPPGQQEQASRRTAEYKGQGADKNFFPAPIFHRASPPLPIYEPYPPICPPARKGPGRSGSPGGIG